MISYNKSGLKALLAAIFLACAMGQNASAAEVGSVKLDDSVKVAGKELKLNGAGMRTKLFVKVYVAGLYLTDKKTNVDDILKAEGPRRVAIHFVRNLSSDDFGDAFMAGLIKNTNDAEKSRLASQISKFGELFGMVQGVSKGDVLTLDWMPGTGTLVTLNGKKVGEVSSEVAAYNAILRIWLGDRPADEKLKKAMINAPKPAQSE
jgi:hypothetical protein